MLHDQMRQVFQRALDALSLRLSARLREDIRAEAASALGAAAADRAKLQEIASYSAAIYQSGRASSERLQLLTGRLGALAVQGRERIDTLGDVEFRVFSQWGEDGIIEWLVSRLTEIPRSFVEFGVENFMESNTRFLLQHRGWKGLVFDGNEAHMKGLRADEMYWKHDLRAVPAFVTAENISDLIRNNGFAGELGILSIDIDGNDYWVYQAIDCVDPWIVIMEINGVFGDLKPFTVPYDPSFSRLEKHYSGQYFGCSVAAARRICEARGYTYLGTNTNGVNAFFVRNDLAPRVVPGLERIKTWPARHRDSRSRDGQLDFVGGLGKYHLVKDLPVFDLDTQSIVAVKDLAPLYSDEFLRDFS